MYVRNEVDVVTMARKILAVVLMYVRNKVHVVPMARKDSSCGTYVRKEQSGRSTHGSKIF